MKKIIQIGCATLILSMGVVAFETRVSAQEFGANTKYYEDDGWLDVTEWFDANDYNPTDEAWWRWDDETYEAAEDISGDRDSDNWYGYTEQDENDWYYDYYDPYTYSYYDYDNNDLYEFGSHYFDYDEDGVYDAVMSYSDWDDDGVYEDFDYYSFTDTGTDKQKQQAKKQVAKESRQQEVTGKIQKTKLVQVRGGKKHIVVAIQPQQGQKDQAMIVDLGSADDLKNVNPKLGDKITVKGPKAQVGQQSVVLARSFELNGQTKQVNRNPRSITGKVVDTRKTKVRGQEHVVAMVETTQGGKSRKVAVDLGRADQLKMDIQKGSNLTFSALPVKVNDKLLMMAQSVQKDGQIAQINRQPMEAAGAEKPAGTQNDGQAQDPKSGESQGQGSSDPESSNKSDQPNP